MIEEFEKPLEIRPEEKAPIPETPKPMEFLEKAKGFLFNPSKTFDAVKPDMLGQAFKYFLCALLIFAALIAGIFGITAGMFFGVIAILLSGLGVPISPLMGAIGLGTTVFAVLTFALVFAVFVVVIFIGGLWGHLWVYMVGGRKGVRQTLKALMYGSTPALLLGWIPVINVPIAAWTVIVQIIGIKQLHGISTKRAVLAFILPFVIFAVIYVAVAVLWLIPAGKPAEVEEWPAKVEEELPAEVEGIKGGPEEMLTSCDQKHTFDSGYEGDALRKCYGQALEGITTSNICEKAGVKDICYLVIALKLNDVSYCAKITDSFHRSACYVDLAIELNQPELCDQEPGPFKKCYEKVAIGLRDSSVCERISESKQCPGGGERNGVFYSYTLCRERCYLRVAEELKDPSLCDYVGKTAIDACRKMTTN